MGNGSKGGGENRCSFTCQVRRDFRVINTLVNKGYGTVLRVAHVTVARKQRYTWQHCTLCNCVTERHRGEDKLAESKAMQLSPCNQNCCLLCCSSDGVQKRQYAIYNTQKQNATCYRSLSSYYPMTFLH